MKEVNFYKYEVLSEISREALKLEYRPRDSVSRNYFATSVSFSTRNANAVIRPASLNFYYRLTVVWSPGRAWLCYKSARQCVKVSTHVLSSYTHICPQLLSNIIFARSIKRVDQWPYQYSSIVQYQFFI